MSAKAKTKAKAKAKAKPRPRPRIEARRRGPERLDATAFAPLSRVEEGAGRTRVVAWLAGGGERRRADGFVDDVAGACAVRVAADGQRRCLPPPLAEVSGRMPTEIRRARSG